MKIEYKGVELDVECEYTEASPTEIDSNTGGVDFGFPAEVEIYSIWHKGTDFYELLEPQLEDIKQTIIEEYEEKTTPLNG